MQVSGDHSQYETLRFMILVVTPVGVVTSTYPQYRQQITTTTTATTTTTPEITTKHQIRHNHGEKHRGLTTISITAEEDSTVAQSATTPAYNMQSKPQSLPVHHVQEEWQLDDTQLVTIVIASCTSLAVALIVVACVSACYFCMYRAQKPTQCQTCYLRASLVDLQAFPSAKVSAENLQRQMIYQPAEKATLLSNATASGPQVSPRYAPLQITAPAPAPLIVPVFSSARNSLITEQPPTSPVSTTIQIEGVWTESTV